MRGKICSLRGSMVVAIALVVSAVFAGIAHADQMADAQALYKKIVWTKGPAKVALGNNADLEVPAGFRFTDAAGARLWAEMNQNPPGSSLGVLTPTDSHVGWFIEFSYEDVGHVADDDKSSLGGDAADKILATCRSSTESANAERQRRGWAPLKIEGWEQKPFYDEATHHMMWAIRASANGEPVVNYKCKLLSREGVMNALFVGSPEELPKAVPVYKTLTQGVTFRPGNRYEEFRSGDKVAKYGLIGLITGTAAVVAVKAWKPIIAAIAAGFAAIGAVLRKIKNFFTGKSNSQGTV